MSLPKEDLQVAMESLEKTLGITRGYHSKKPLCSQQDGNNHYRKKGEQGVGEGFTLLAGMQNADSLWNTAWQLHKQLNLESPYKPKNSISGHRLKELKVGAKRKVCTHMFIGRSNQTPMVRRMTKQDARAEEYILHRKGGRCVGQMALLPSPVTAVHSQRQVVEGEGEN